MYSLVLNAIVIAPSNLKLISGITLVPQLSASLPTVGAPSLGGSVNLTFTNPYTFPIKVRLWIVVIFTFRILTNGWLGWPQLGYSVRNDDEHGPFDWCSLWKRDRAGMVGLELQQLDHHELPAYAGLQLIDDDLQ